MNDEIVYARETTIDPDEFIALMNESTLSERRPVSDRHRIIKMCRNANLIITARINNHLVGIARCLTDFTYCTYLSDLAVSEAFQKRGIGKELIRRVNEAVPEATVILLAAPKAVMYYPKIGMVKHDAAYIIRGH